MSFPESGWNHGPNKGRLYMGKRTISTPKNPNHCRKSSSHVAVAEWPASVVDRLFANHAATIRGNIPSGFSPLPASYFMSTSFANLCCMLLPVRSGSAGRRESLRVGCGRSRAYEHVPNAFPPRSEQVRRLSLTTSLTLLYDIELWLEQRRQGISNAAPRTGGQLGD